MVSITEKYLLTVEEASKYFNIGRDKLYELAKENEATLVLYHGRKILIKRKNMEAYLNGKTCI